MTEPAAATAFARIENHYFLHGGWFDEGQLIAGVDAIRDIPAVIVQGRYDVCTPPMTAWELHRAWPEAEFVMIPDAAHSASEPGIAAALRAATDRFASACRRRASPAEDDRTRSLRRSRRAPCGVMASSARMSRMDTELTPVFDRPVRGSASAHERLGPDELLPQTAYQIVHDETMLDGNARLNLATFVTTWMDEYANRLYQETYDKNMIDKDEYPSTAAVEDRCWRILANLWSVPTAEGAIGTSTTGSSEACMLGGLAFKRLWQHRRRAEGASTEKPNLIMSSAVQVCWEKFCNYWDVEMRLVPVSEEHPVLDGFELEKYIDENTIGVVAIMGVTYTGAYEPVAQIAAKLDEIQATTGFDIPIHVDGASGAMVAPFLQPDLEWDFRLERVHSISTSGHKYGGVLPGARVGRLAREEVAAARTSSSG